MEGDHLRRLALFTLALLIATGLAASGRAKPTPPNIVVILVDDLSPLDGRLWDALPNIRQTFIDRGVTFEDFHVEAPLCCPGRAGFLTGQHTRRHGVTRNDARLFDPTLTIATQLRAAGYHTFHAGKYLNHFRYVRSTPPGWDRFDATEGRYYGYRLWRNGRVERRGTRQRDYSTDLFGRLAVDAISTAPRDRPLFGWIAPFAPHDPMTPAPRDRDDPRCERIEPWQPANYAEADVSDKPRHVRARKVPAADAYDLGPVCRSMLAVDRLVGDVRAALQRTGRLSNTLLVFTSDNGMTYGAHRWSSKGVPYASHVPFLASWPGRLGDRPRLVTERLQNIDLAPTLCELAGCSLAADGRSFASLLVDGQGSLDRDAVLESLPETIWFAGWEGITTTAASQLATRGCELAATADCRWQYVEYVSGERELYDLSNGPCWRWRPGEPGDPCRLTNRAGDERLADVEREMSVSLERMRASAGD